MDEKEKVSQIAKDPQPAAADTLRAALHEGVDVVLDVLLFVQRVRALLWSLK